MSKAKNRFRSSDGLVHFTKRPDRRNNYFVQQCNAAVVYNATDEALALTCLVCMDREAEHKRKVEEERLVACDWCGKRQPFKNTYSPGDCVLCAACNATVPRS